MLKGCKLFLIRLVNLFRFLLAFCQILYAFSFGSEVRAFYFLFRLKLIANFLKELPPLLYFCMLFFSLNLHFFILILVSIDHFHNYGSQKSTTLFGLESIMCCSRWKCRIFHSFLFIIMKSHWNRCKSHQRSVSIVEVLNFSSIGSELSLVREEFIHRDFDVSAQADWVSSSTITQTLA